MRTFNKPMLYSGMVATAVAIIISRFLYGHDWSDFTEGLFTGFGIAMMLGSIIKPMFSKTSNND